MKVIGLALLIGLSSNGFAKSTAEKDRCEAVVNKFAEASSLSFNGTKKDYSWELISETFERTYTIHVNDWSHLTLVLSNDSASMCVFDSLKFERDND